MRKRVLSLVLILLCCLAVKAQDNNTKLFTATNVVWCGLDYSYVKCIGSEGFTDPEDITRRFFDSWNKLMLDEASKYDFREEYEFKGLLYDLSVVKERNDIPKADELVINTDYSLPEGKLKEIVSDYDLDKVSEGLGLVYVMESLNKFEKKASIYVVFFDIATKEIVWSKKYYGSAGGFGLRNYWARSVLGVLNQSAYDITRDRKRFAKGKL
ncbi:hypothetical protein [Fulvivirga sediminis]|uniref:DUF4136 domain-containing protein n=1 Tax=Fulvivirga sediminis TaxID=2803949 RepID=A0A937F918_9BACT|nr:hypothetical protein [Fulvivirga sediminis]MBL3656849.1 hypothetical protein [Fulvivirga sediminis]